MIIPQLVKVRERLLIDQEDDMQASVIADRDKYLDAISQEKYEVCSD